MGEIFLVSSTKSPGLSKDRGFDRAEATLNLAPDVKCRCEIGGAIGQRREELGDARTELLFLSMTLERERDQTIDQR